MKSETDNAAHMPSGSELQRELKALLEDVSARHSSAVQALHRFQDVYPEAASVEDISRVLEGVYDTWLTGVIARFQRIGQGIGNAVISLNSVPEALRTNHDIIRSSRVRKTDVCLVHELMDWFDGETLVKALQGAASELETRGIVEAADKLLGDLGMRADWNADHPAKRTARYVVFSKRIYGTTEYGYDYRLPEQLHDLANAFDVAGEDSGLEGLGQAAHAIAQAFQQQRELFPSRTQLCAGGLIVGVVFKEKIELRVSHEVGDGLLAFLKLNSSHEIRPVE